MSAPVSMRRGDRISSYKLVSDFTPVGNCRWAFAERSGEHFFLKEFLRPKYPPDFLEREIRRAKLQRCEIFESRHKRLITTLASICAPGGNIVAPIDFFRFGLAYYHVSPRVNVETVGPVGFSKIMGEKKIILLKTLVNSIGLLHRKRIVHCDLKPANILIQKTSTGNFAAKIIDLDGSFFDMEAPDKDEMQFDQQYMSPEILSYNRGGDKDLATGNISIASDIFSLGLILYEFWTGTAVTFDRKKHGDPASAVLAGSKLVLEHEKLPHALSDAIERSFDRVPQRRPTAADLVERLRGIDGDHTSVRPKISSTATVRISGAKHSGSTPVSHAPHKTDADAMPSERRTSEAKKPALRFSKNLLPK